MKSTIEYFIVESNIKDTNEIRSIAKKYIDISKIKQANTNYYEVAFYKSRDGFDKTYVCSANDFIDNHGKDLLIRFIWINDSINYFEHYRNGILITNSEDVKLE